MFTFDNTTDKMNFEKIQQLDHYIKSKNTGTPTELAKKMCISKSMVHRYIGFMRGELKAPIKYNRMNETYVYEEQGKLYLEGWE